MAKKTLKLSQSKPQPYHPEAKGLITLAFCLFLGLCLISFNDGDPSGNCLGLAGYSIAWGFNYLFGLGSFLILGFLTWIGWKYIKSKTIENLGITSVYFSIFLLSTCVLLNLAAETKALDYPLLNMHVYSESILLKGTFSHRYIRYNLGGVPLYYMYRDLPVVNLQHLLSDVGVFSTFFIIQSVCFILLTNIRFLQILNVLKKVLLFIQNFLVTAFKEVKNYSDDLAEQVDEKAITPIIKKGPSLETIKKLQKERSSKISITQIKSSSEIENQTNIEEDPELTIHAYKEPTIKFSDRNIKFKSHTNFKFPPLSLLTDTKKIDQPTLEKDLKRQAEILEETLMSFGIEAKVGEINCGPTITSFALHPAIGVKVQKIKTLENDIALNLQAKSIRIIAPIPGKAAVGVEVPSLYPQEVGFKDMLYQYNKQPKKYRIPVLLGKTVNGENVMSDLTKMPHCLIAGATGSGKSVCINTIIMSILMTSHPDDTKLLLIDPKKVELTPFSKLPHLIAPVITEPHGAYASLSWLVKEMQTRYEILKQLGLRNISAFNSRKINLEVENSLDIEIPEKMPFMIMIIDEFADLMMTSSSDLETPIARIAQMARAVGIHLILATQRPSREVITGLIKANFPTRIAFKVSSRINSQIILDENGADTLLGNGDMLFLPPGSSQLVRAQGVYIRDEDINRIIEHIQNQAPTNYLIKSFDEMNTSDMELSQGEAPRDSLYDQALSLVLSTRTASTTFLQRKLKVGYARAASLMDELEDRGVISAQDGSRARKVLIQNDATDFLSNKD